MENDKKINKRPTSNKNVQHGKKCKKISDAYSRDECNVHLMIKYQVTLTKAEGHRCSREGQRSHKKTNGNIS